LTIFWTFATDEEKDEKVLEFLQLLEVVKKSNPV